MITSCRWTEPLIDVAKEVGPFGDRFVLWEAHVPLLGATYQMKRGIPDLLVFWCLLASEKLLATVDPWQWTFLAIERGERQLVDAWLED